MMSERIQQTQAPGAYEIDGLRLLPLEALENTGRADHAEWNYRPLLGQIQRVRFKEAVSMFAGERFGRLLEVGYGSGVFMPELKRHCDDLYGIDIHHEQLKVQRALERHGIAAELFSDSVTHMPFASDMFDCIVAISSLEYVDDVEAACHEMKRVLTSNGVVLVVTPGFSPVLDLALKIVTGESAKENYANRRSALIPTLLRYFSIEHKVAFPRIGVSQVQLYSTLRLLNKVLS